MKDTKLNLWIRELPLTARGVPLIQAVVFLFGLYLSGDSLHKQGTFIFGTRWFSAIFLFPWILHVRDHDFNTSSILFNPVAQPVRKTYRNLQLAKFYSAVKEQSR